MVNTIERIHRDFSVDLLEELRAANEAAFLERICPPLVKKEKFIERVTHYRQHYPTYNFVTEQQIEEICIRYGLVFGSLMTFSGTIPVKNRLEIRNFNLRAADATFVDASLPGRIYGLALNNGSATQITVPERGGHGTIDFRSGFLPADPDRPFDVIPVGEHFTLVRNPDETSYRLYLEIDVCGSPWLIQYGVARINFGEVFITWRAERFGNRIIQQSEVGLRLTMRQIQESREICLRRNVSPMVVGDRSMFTRFGDAVETVGHRLKFKRAQMPPGGAWIFTNDPIILQPVPYGYLVVTKWGAESNIPEIIDGRSN